MTRTRWTRLTLALIVTAACGDAAAPGTESATDTTPGPTVDDTTSPVPTTGEPDDTGSSLSEDGTTTSPPTTAPPPACTDASQCPPTANPCESPTCTDAGECAFAPLDDGSPLPDDPGNCVQRVCDGAGGTKDIADDDPPSDTPDDCLAPTCQDGASKMVPADDPPADTPGDCKATTCEAGEVVFVADDADLPDDTIECTTDTCANGTPSFVPRPVNSFCGEMGEMFCHSDTECEPCKEVSDACEDETNTEANESQPAAHDLGNINDNDASGKFLCPVLDGAADVDWFTFTGDDVFPYVVDPNRIVTSDFNARICVYLECLSGTTSVSCDADDVADIAPLGQKGCCGMGSVSPGINCTGLDDAADVWIKVENVDMLACVPYQLQYHY